MGPDQVPVEGDPTALQDVPRKLVQVKTSGGIRWAAVAVIMAILIGILMSMEHMADNMGEFKPRLVMVDGNMSRN